MQNNLPIYKISIDDEYSDGEDLGIQNIAFTSSPAIKVKGMAFKADEPNKQYFGDKVKYRITAPALIPMDIYRADDSGEYYVQFTQNEIERIYSKYMKNFTNRQVFNLEHNNDDKVPAYVLESWIVEKPNEDKALSSYGIKVPVGTVMVTAQVTDPSVYQELVDNEQTGFSIEGFLGLSLSEIINKQKEKQTKMEEQKMHIPAGEYVMGDKIYVVAEDGTFEIKEAAPAVAMAEDEKPKEEETKKEELAEEEAPKEDEKPKEEELAEEDAPVGEFYSKEEVDAKFDEIYKMIAEIKSEETAQDFSKVEPQKMSEVKLSAFEMFTTSKNKNQYY